MTLEKICAVIVWEKLVLYVFGIKRFKFNKSEIRTSYFSLAFGFFYL